MCLISHPSNCSVDFAMYVHVQYYRANEIIFNSPESFNIISFLNSKKKYINICNITYSGVIEKILSTKK